MIKGLSLVLSQVLGGLKIAVKEKGKGRRGGATSMYFVAIYLFLFFFGDVVSFLFLDLLEGEVEEYGRGKG